MTDQPVLTEAEWALVAELLDRELHDLPGEIHHTRTSRVRDDLRTRKEMIQRLLDRLRPAAVA